MTAVSNCNRPRVPLEVKIKGKHHSSGVGTNLIFFFFFVDECEFSWGILQNRAFPSPESEALI